MWLNKNNKLEKEYTFADFKQALTFIERVGAISEEMGHHPTIINTYNTVKLELSTHDIGGVTVKDFELAGKIDDLTTDKVEHIKSNSTEKLEIAKLYADGGSRGNPGPSAGGYVILSMDDTVVKSNGKYLGITTNNQAEYHSLKGGLEMALEMGVKEIDVYMDSLLVINQMKGIYKIRNRDLWPIHDAIKGLSKQFRSIKFTHVPRELNKLADAVVNETLDQHMSSGV